MPKLQITKNLSLREIAKDLEMPYQQVYEAMRTGKLRADQNKRNGRYFVTPQNFARFKDMLKRWQLTGGSGVPRPLDEGELPFDHEVCREIGKHRIGRRSFYQAKLAYEREKRKRLDRYIKEKYSAGASEGDAA